MATEAVYQFMKNQNRPYSVNEILQNVGKELGKSAVQKALDKLVDKDKLFEKTYGKQKVYCIVQSDGTDSNKLEEELKEMNREMNTAKLQLQEVQEKIRANSAKLKEHGNSMTVEEARQQEAKLKSEIRSFKEEVDRYDAEYKPVSEEEKRSVTEKYERYEKEYKKRKRMCKEIIGQIMESYPKTEKKLVEDIRIETDEDVAFKL